MNLVISGSIDATLRGLVTDLAQPSCVIAVSPTAYRLEDTNPSGSARTAIASLCDLSRVDHAYVNPAVRLNDMKLLAVDMDSTLITIECIDEIADFAGKKKEVAAITEATMNGEITDFAESLRRRVALLEGTPIDILRRVFDERLKLANGALDLITCAQQAGVFTILLSGGFTYFSDRLKNKLNLDASHSNVLHISNGVLAGTVAQPIIGPREKAELVKAAMQKLNCSPNNAVAIGDGANDIPMMQCVKHSFAYHAKKIVAAEACYAINFGTLKTVLDILG